MSAVTATPVTSPAVRAPIRKRAGSWRIAPNLADYDAARSGFDWAAAEHRELDGLPNGGGLNIAHEAVDRHATGARGQHVALRGVAAAHSSIHGND